MAQISYFLGANTPNGFYSRMEELLPRERTKELYLLKGGPGCGKSSLMKKIGQTALERGEVCEFIHCSGDPDSLDALILPGRGVAIADATAPHVLEPKLPGIVEQYVNLGQFYDHAALAPLRDTAEGLQGRYQACYKRAYRCLKGAEGLERDDLELVNTPEVRARIRKRARGVILREVPRRGAGGRVTTRFLDAISCQGRITFWDTVKELCPRVFELSDRYGLSCLFLEEVLAAAPERGQDVIVCPDPMAVNRPRHLLLPGLKLAFVTTSPEAPLPFKPFRRVRLDAMISPEVLRQNKARLKFSQKIAQSLEAEGMESLASAKALHDQLESLYNPHMNFDGVYETARQLSREIFGD